MDTGDEEGGDDEGGNADQERGHVEGQDDRPGDPQTYYVSTVPVEISWPIVLALNVATLLVSVAALVVPSFLASHIHPAKSMHYE